VRSFRSKNIHSPNRYQMMTPIRPFFAAALVVVGGVLFALSGNAQNSPAPSNQPTPVTATATQPPVPPRAQTYVRVQPEIVLTEGHTLIPVVFLQNTLGVALQTVTPNRTWRIAYFEHRVEFTLGSTKALFDDEPATLPSEPRILAGRLYLPWTPLAQLFGVKWSIPQKQGKAEGTLLLLQYQAAYIENIRHSASPDKIRVVMDLSNATRVTARHTSSGVTIYLSAARRPEVASQIKVGEYLMPRISTQSGNWKASTQIQLNYAAPTTWFTIGNPPRIVVDVQKLFEQTNAQNLDGGLTYTKIFRGTGHGPVRIFMARADPKKGWRLRVAPAGYSVLKRDRVSHIAARHKAPIGVNGGFFAFDGAAVGAVKVNGEWLRLPWKGRSAIAFKPNGEAKIDGLQVKAVVRFSNGLELPIRDLNGWPDRNHVTALTRHFGTLIQLRAGETATVVEKGVVTSTPGSGNVNIPAHGFVLVANGGAIPELAKARRGLKADLIISAPGWEGYTSALGGGPRLVSDGTAEVKEEGFRSDVRNGLAPRTAVGIDKDGRYIIVVVDGRQGFYSTGMTLLEMAYTMQKFGAVDAVNMDGGGSAAMYVRGKIVNRPSDGAERRVSNALLVMR
jgi:hypothetical protein